MSELIPPSETSEPTPIRTGTITAEDQKKAVVRLGSAKGGWWRQVGWMGSRWSWLPWSMRSLAAAWVQSSARR